MGIYLTQEIGFDLPASWTDATVNMLEYSIPAGIVRIGLSRGSHAGQKLADLLDEYLLVQRRSLPQYEITQRRERPVISQMGIEVVATFKDATHSNHQRFIALITGANWNILAVTGPTSVREQIDSTYERVVATLQLRIPPSSPNGVIS